MASISRRAIAARAACDGVSTLARSPAASAPSYSPESQPSSPRLRGVGRALVAAGSSWVTPGMSALVSSRSAAPHDGQRGGSPVTSAEHHGQRARCSGRVGSEAGPVMASLYSHSIVAGGVLGGLYITLVTPGTSFTTQLHDLARAGV